MSARWIAAGAAVVVLGAAGPAAACKCGVTSRDQAIASNPVVFEGRIVNIQTTGKTQTTTMSIVRPIKGVSGGETLKVRSHTQSAACGYDFRKARSTLLVGGQGAGRGVVSVRRCTMYNLNPGQD